MRLFKRIGCGLLALFLSLQLTAPVNSYAAVRFSDTAGHWAEDYINDAVNKKIISGYPSGKFMPDKAVTRAEFATMVNKTLGNTGTTNITFNDVNHGDWYYNDVSKALAATYTAGYTDSTFRPNSPITRQEAAVMLSRIVPTYGKDGNLRAFSDYRSIDDWAYDSLEKINGKGYIGAYDDRKIHPTDQLTRAQTAKIICEIIDHENIITKNTVIDDDGTKLSGRIYANNVKIDEDLGEDSTIIENCIVLGKLSVQGGGTDTVTVSNSRVANATVDKDDDPVRVLAKGETAIVRLSASKSSILQTSSLKGGLFGPGFSNVTVNGSAEVVLRGNFPKVNVSGSKAQMDLDSGTIDSLNVSGKYSDITAESGTSIRTVTVNAQSYFHGSGTISYMIVNADNVTYETKPKKWTIASSADTPSKANDDIDITFSPKNDATNVKLDGDITITFDSSVEMHDGDSISNSDIDDFIELRKNSSTGSTVDFSASINSSKKVITITPNSSLALNQKYYLAVVGYRLKAKDDGYVIPASSVTWTTTWTTGIITPVLSNLVVSSGDTSITATMTPNVAGKVYAVVVPSGAPAPSAAQIAAGQNNSGAPALASSKVENAAAAVPVTLSSMGGLASGTVYDVWATLYSTATGSYSAPVRQSMLTTKPRITLNNLTVKPIIEGTTRENQISFNPSNYNYAVGLNSSIRIVEFDIKADSEATITLTGNSLGTISGTGGFTTSIDIAANPSLSITISDSGKTSSTYTLNLNPVNDTTLKTLKIGGASQTVGGNVYSFALPSCGATRISLDVTTNDKYAIITDPIGSGLTITKISNDLGHASYNLDLPEGAFPVAIKFNVISGSSADPPYIVTFDRP